MNTSAGRLYSLEVMDRVISILGRGSDGLIEPDDGGRIKLVLGSSQLFVLSRYDSDCRVQWINASLSTRPRLPGVDAGDDSGAHHPNPTNPCSPVVVSALVPAHTI